MDGKQYPHNRYWEYYRLLSIGLKSRDIPSSDSRGKMFTPETLGPSNLRNGPSESLVGTTSKSEGRELEMNKEIVGTSGSCGTRNGEELCCPRSLLQIVL